MKKLIAAAILAFAGLAQAQLPPCDSVCHKTTPCSNQCQVNGFFQSCGDYGVCKKGTGSRVEALLEAPPPPKSASVGAVLDSLPRK